MVTTPSLTGLNGRDTNGRFAKGNKASRGNPHAKCVNRFRSMLLEHTSESDHLAICRKLVECVKAGEPWAVKEYRDRVMGKPKMSVELENPAPFILYRNIDDNKI